MYSLITECIYTYVYGYIFQDEHNHIEDCVFVMATSNSPLGNSTDAVRGTEVISCDQSKKAVQFSNSEILLLQNNIFGGKRARWNKMQLSDYLGTTDFLELNQDFKNREYLKRKKFQTLYFNLSFCTSQKGNLNNLKILCFNSPFSNPEY